MRRYRFLNTWICRWVDYQAFSSEELCSRVLETLLFPQLIWLWNNNINITTEFSVSEFSPHPLSNIPNSPSSTSSSIVASTLSCHHNQARGISKNDPAVVTGTKNSKSSSNNWQGTHCSNWTFDIRVQQGQSTINRNECSGTSGVANSSSGSKNIMQQSFGIFIWKRLFVSRSTIVSTL